MTQIMTPSVMTDGQIDKAVEVYRSMLRKYRSELGSDAVQQVLGQSDYLGEMVGVLRKRVEAVSEMMVRRVKVDRTRTPQECLNATGRNQYIDDEVVAGMPKGDGNEVDVFFFKVGRFISDANLDKEYELRGLKPADPYSLSAVNEADPTFADKYFNGTHWKNCQGKWCFAAFDLWDDDRGVSVYRSDGDWDGDWLFAGVRK